MIVNKMPRQQEREGGWWWWFWSTRGGCSRGRLVEESGICGSFENVGGSQIK